MSAAAKAMPSANKAWLRALEMTARIDAAPSRTLAVAVEEWAARGDAPALLGEGASLSYRELAARANAVARWALDQGITKGEVVALMLDNCPDYMAIWLGITRIGGVVALLNTNLSGEALAHAVAVAAPKLVIAGSDHERALFAASVKPGAIWIHGDGVALYPRLDEALTLFSGAALTESEQRDVTLRDPALLIYTSGTTGLSKAARVSHHRLMMWSHWFAGLTGAGPDDRLYNCLPMYHSVGGVVATGAMLAAGGSVFLRGKFSASAFWEEVARFDCTIFQYIGELCRYLLATAPRPHRLRLAVGNGLRADVWEEFQQRFAIPQILEFYAATEGNFSLYNVEGKPGAIGRIPPFLAHRFGVAIVKHDAETGMPLRGADGFCVPCARMEAGEAIGKIAPGARFEGYSDARATQKKILRDVFEKGDAWFRTGDLMRRDAQGFFHFVDRIGDTFRWKGENVSSAEVAAAILDCPGVEAATVYGVAVPGAEGRAGMAAIMPEAGFDLTRLHEHLKARLPGYARPLFLRLVDSLAMTETFKQKKHGLACQGFDPAHGAVWFDDGANYAPLDAEAYARIASGLTRI